MPVRLQIDLVCHLIVKLPIVYLVNNLVRVKRCSVIRHPESFNVKYKEYNYHLAKNSSTRVSSVLDNNEYIFLIIRKHLNLLFLA